MPSPKPAFRSSFVMTVEEAVEAPDMVCLLLENSHSTATLTPGIVRTSHAISYPVAEQFQSGILPWIQDLRSSIYGHFQSPSNHKLVPSVSGRLHCFYGQQFKDSGSLPRRPRCREHLRPRGYHPTRPCALLALAAALGANARSPHLRARRS